MHPFKIEKNIPVPKREQCKEESVTEVVRKFMMSMSEGDSMFLPDKKCYNAAKNATKNCHALDKDTFKIFSENGGYRIFKIAIQ